LFYKDRQLEWIGEKLMPLFSKKPGKKPTRLYFATDLHGSERTYRKFINAGKFYDVDILGAGNRETGFN
jgi:hypothetical protein